MRLLYLLTLLPFILFADFTLVYKLDTNFTQEFYFKDPQHLLFTFKEGNKTFEKLLINRDEKFLSLFEGGIENIYQIDDNISDPIPENSTPPEYKIVKKLEQFKYQEFNASKWVIDDNNSNIEVTVTNDPKLASAITKMITALKQLLPADKQGDADIFNMGKGYVLLAKENLKLLSFNQEPLSLSLFTTGNTLSKEEQEEFNKETQRCFLSLCCGRKHFKGNSIPQLLYSKVDGWRRTKFAKCENIDYKSGLESALYKKGDKVIVAEMITGDNSLYGKIESLQEQGVKIDNVKQIKIKGFDAIVAYLPFIDTTIVDITLPTTTLSIYTKGKTDLLPFVEQSIKFHRLTNY